MRNRSRDSLKTIERDWYEGKLTRHNHFDALGHIDHSLNRVPVEFVDEDRCRFMASCFGHFLTMHREMKFSGGIIHRLLLRELHHKGSTDEMQFILGNQSVRFSKVEFFLITGLRFGVVPDMTKYAAVENGIHERYFPGADEVSLEEISSVIIGAEFRKAYDAVKLCLIYMLNWILIGVDERFKIPVWQFWLVEDLDAFEAFPWGAHVYRHSIYSFKHAFDWRRDRFERRQQEKGTDVIPDLAKEFGAQRVTDMTPRILKWELTKQPRGKNMAKIFKARMFARKELVPTPVERQTPYYAWLNEGGAYPQRERHRHRHRWVRFTTPGYGTSIEDSRRGIGRDGEAPWADMLNDVHEALWKSEEDRQRQHLELVNMIRKSDEDRQ
ncbi:hypothetical protein Ddye_026384 [Dipteronia dyeriana]|uniref:DUF1985 domain-containing protein n=1 Tax=Dipteronia dyeriana TaxID=168575 RepID=A0AAD9TM23_9ROSI|nr:hypothetical protein Ddye_026384 [Dipteronia dyeriana]